MSIIYDTSSTSSKISTIEYCVNTSGDRIFVPINSDDHGGGDGDGDMADQLAQFRAMSPKCVEKVLS